MADSVFDYLKDHALKNVWCTPDQDIQYIIEPKRITKNGGLIGKVTVGWTETELPDTTSNWHVYQIGQVHPLILGLFPQSNQWISFADTSNRQKMLCDLYVTSGIQIPRFETFYKYTLDKNVIIAVRRNNKIAYNFNEDKVFLRVYSNDFFNTSRSDTDDDRVYVEGITVSTSLVRTALIASYDAYKVLPGVTCAFVNGRFMDRLDILNVAIGDTAEFVYDSSIYKVVDFKIGDLHEFNSTMDLKRKYLLHYAGVNNETIDYQDDIDVYLIRPTAVGRFRGLYYNKNNPDAFRNLTHKDYSITVDYISSYMEKLKSLVANTNVLDYREMYVRLHIRKSGYYRPLVFETNRINELYKMSDEDIQKAMLGFDATVDNWRAATLEASAYIQVMRSKCCDITNEMVQNAYGYNASAKLLANTPLKTYLDSGDQTVILPYALQEASTVYEYDADGYLLGFYHHTNGYIYRTIDPDARMVEVYSGLGSAKLDETYGEVSVPINRKHSYRVYEARLSAGVPNNKFVDVTDTPLKYKFENSRFVWTEPATYAYPMIRSSARFLAYDQELTMNNGELKLTISHLQTRNGRESKFAMQVPMGELDIFLNGRLLISNLDYILNFPQIVIINKKYLVNPTTETQQIHVRFCGFCKPDLTLNQQEDVGFIEHGYLSNNTRYDIRDDKVQRITVDGALKHIDDLEFSEFNNGVSVIDADNGLPYSVRDISIPLRGNTTEDSFSLRDKARVVDKRISDYLTLKIPQPERPAPSAIVDRYPIFSPFVCKIIYDLADGYLTLDDKVYSKQEVIDKLKTYEYLLKFDPTQEEHAVNANYVIIHPHSLDSVITLPLNKYRFLNKVVDIYCNGLINTSPFIALEAPPAPAPAPAPGPVPVPVIVTYTDFGGSVISAVLGAQYNHTVATFNVNYDTPLSSLTLDGEFSSFGITQTQPPLTAPVTLWFDSANKRLVLRGTVSAGQSAINAIAAGKGAYVKNTVNTETTATVSLRIQTSAAPFSMLSWLGSEAQNTPSIIYNPTEDGVIFRPGPQDERAVLSWENLYVDGGDVFDIIWTCSEDSQADTNSSELRLGSEIAHEFVNGIGTYSARVTIPLNQKLESHITTRNGQWDGAGKYMKLVVAQVGTGRVWDSTNDYRNAYGKKNGPWDYFYRTSPEEGLVKNTLTATVA